MRGAYYVATALFVVACSRTAAESDQRSQIQTSDHGITAADTAVTKSLAKRFLPRSRDVHDDLALPAANEERGTSLSMSTSMNALSDAEKAFAALKTAVAKASEKAVLELPPSLRDDATAIAAAPHEWFGLKWIQSVAQACADKIKWQRQETYESPVFLDIPHVAGHPSTSSEREHFEPLSNVKKRRGAISEHQLDHASPFKKIRRPRKSFLKYGPDHAKLIAVHAAFSDLYSSLYKPTKEETASLWSLMRYLNVNGARHDVKIKATRYAILEVMKLMEDETARGQWARLTHSQRVNFVNMSLVAHFKRWKGMFELFSQVRPDIDKLPLETKNFLADVGKQTQPSLDVNIEESNYHPSLMPVGSQYLHMFEPTSDSATTDFLSKFSQDTQRQP